MLCSSCVPKCHQNRIGFCWYMAIFLELKSFLFGLSFCLWQRIQFIDYVQRSSSSLYRILRYRNCLNYITLHLAILNTAPVHHLDLWRWQPSATLYFRNFESVPRDLYLSPCDSASPCKISLKNRLLSFGQTTICNMAAVRHLELEGSKYGFFEKLM